MKIIKLHNIVFLVIISFLFIICTEITKAEDQKKTDTEFNLYSGSFDFSDHGKRSNMFGLEHQNEELYRSTFMGKISPITGGFFTEAGATYLYTGVQAEYELGIINFTPSLTPGYYNPGDDGKDLGHALEFKSEIQLSLDLFKNSHLGMSYNHISNASLGKDNPGANSYTFNFLQKF